MPAREDGIAVTMAKLSEVRHFLSEAEKHYFDPDLFRINMNACIQSIRNVTFAVQNSKGSIPDFDTWYAPWQEYLKSQAILRWLVAARNRIVKQGDLKLHSLLRVGLVLSYYDLPYREYAVPLRLNTEQIIRRIQLPPLPHDVRKDAFVRIERRWVANDLVDYELIDVLKYAARVLDGLVQDLQGYLRDRTTEIPNFPIPKTYAVLHPRAIFVKLSDGSVISGFSTEELPATTTSAKEVMDRYGALPFSDLPKGAKASLRDMAYSLAKHARRVLEVDGFHQTIAMLISDKQEMKLVSLRPTDNADKYLLYRKLADDVREFDATSVLIVGEMWTAKFDESAPHRRAVDSPARGEALSVVAASKDGNLIALTQPFTRDGEKLKFAELTEFELGAYYMLEPIRAVWGLPPFETKLQT